MKIEFGKTVRIFKSQNNRDVLIRWVKESDLKFLLDYVNGLIAEDTFVMVSGKPMTIAEEKIYLDEAIDKIRNNRKIHLVCEVDGRFAGSGEVRFFERRKSHVGEIGISLTREFREAGIGTVFLQTLVAEAQKMGLRLLTLTCFENNLRAIHTYEKVGFSKSGIVPEALMYQGKYYGEETMYLKL